ncbi:MAG: tyrosine-type recombinase/integrase [Beijerinckiaceae bacterium]
MKTHHPANERIKRDYFTYLKEARRYSETSLDGVAAALHRFEVYTKFRDFKAFHIQQAVAFKAHLAEQLSTKTGERLSKASLYATLRALKTFFIWLAGQPGYRSRLAYADAEYFNLSEKDTRVAKARREQHIPTLEQIRHVIEAMPSNTEIERRDRALVAFILLTGARDGAAATFKLKHVDLIEGRIEQDAREVATKFSKTFTTWFFPVGNDILQIVTGWVDYLRKEKLWSLDDPLFPATRIIVGNTGQFEVAGLARQHWSTATPIRNVFKIAFERAALPYFIPHSFRKTLAVLGEKTCRTPEEFKAWSQNLGHEKVLTTFSSYGEVGRTRQAEIIRALKNPTSDNDEATLRLARVIRNAGVFPMQP